ncbi:uncharacterized protein RCC_06589 [Ramularia collo-cygni]|uniref:DUF1989 domain-containing protein n=1 Tax=Ramularia collo-cygni TaxID=112498 RepID=A0A2D3UVK6_9PEZI|nr:uncharacterized protein RCC_06589 [Ramularia collo-cygni]CZT20731.1 uncharacterized protein RCC_06589 [Ramularia collo-cygni]
MELQSIPARSGTATFLPAGKCIKIVNTSGTQVIDTWAFALPKPDPKQGGTESEVEKEELPKQNAPQTPKKNAKRTSELPSQEEAEEATRKGLAQGEKSAEDSSKQRTSWSGYLPSVPSVPSLGFGKGKIDGDAAASKDEQAKDSKTWSSYFAAGKGFSSYIPQQASDTVTQFAGYHARDNNKTYMQQLQDFSKTPVGAAGMAAITGSGYGSSLYAGYSAWNLKHANNAPAMELLSVSHSRASTLHLIPQVHDTLVTNLREPILTLVEDTSPGTHDTLIPACDPNQYKQLGAPDWEKHGSCAENLVLALKELNERAGLKGAKGVGADVSVNTVPAPLNLFMNVPWEKEGELKFGKPKSKPGDYVRFFAERDVVVVMSACPQDITGINGEEIKDAHFIVEDAEEAAKAFRRMPPTNKSTPRKAGSDPARKKAPVAPQQASESQAPQPAKATPSRPIRKRSTQSASEKATQPATTSRPQKKPIPPSAAVPTNGEAAAPKERKKPRKLNVRQKGTAEN